MPEALDTTDLNEVTDALRNKWAEDREEEGVIYTKERIIYLYHMLYDFASELDATHLFRTSDLADLRRRLIISARSETYHKDSTKRNIFLAVAKVIQDDIDRAEKEENQ